MNPFVPDELRKAAGIYEERNKVYGDNYKTFGSVVQPMLKDVKLETVADYNRLGIFVQIMSKITRYAQNFNSGGHDDSLRDAAVYCVMLLELDSEGRKEKQTRADAAAERYPGQRAAMATAEAFATIRERSIREAAEKGEK